MKKIAKFLVSALLVATMSACEYSFISAVAGSNISNDSVSIIDGGTFLSINSSGTSSNQVSAVVSEVSYNNSVGQNNSTSQNNSSGGTGDQTLQEQFAAIVPFQGGLSAIEFFTKTSKIGTKTSGATQMALENNYEEGVMGPTFGMESDVGYTKQDETTVCKLYGSNEMMDCTLDSETTKSTSPTPHVINGAKQKYAEGNTIYTIVDDGTESFDIPDNYREIQTKSAGEPLSNYIGFSLNTNTLSLIKFMLNSHYVSGSFNPETEKYYTTKNGGWATLNYLYYEEYENTEKGNYEGHAQVVKVEVTFDEQENVVGAKFINEYIYNDYLVFSETGAYQYGYADNGAFTGTKLNPLNYLNKGTIIPNVAEGEYHAKTDDYLAMLNDALTGIIDLEAPTNTYADISSYEKFESYSSTRETIYNELYDDNVLMTYVQGGTNEEYYVYWIQTTKDQDNIYEIVIDDPNYRDYKIITPIAQVEDVDAIFDLRDYQMLENLDYMVSTCTSGALCAATADMLDSPDVEARAEGNELVIIVFQAAIQQTEGVLGYLITFEIGFEVLRDAGGNVTGISLVYSFYEELSQFDWVVYAQTYYYFEYGYEEMGEYPDNYLLDPNDYNEL